MLIIQGISNIWLNKRLYSRKCLWNDKVCYRFRVSYCVLPEYIWNKFKMYSLVRCAVSEPSITSCYLVVW